MSNQQATVEAVDESTPKRLTGRLGTADIVFTVLAFNAPMAVFVGYLTVIIGYGNGLGAPVTYVAAAALMLLFAVGFTAMSRHLPNPGAFYAYITAGLGRPLGLGSSFLAIVSYYFILLGGYALGGVGLESLVRDVFGGPDLAWWFWVLVLMALAGTLGYFNIKLSARVLTIFMAAEVVLIVAFDTVAFANGGPEGITLLPFAPSNIFSGTIGLAVLFGIVCFSGFEATAVFREEARNPERTIPRATYIAIISMGLIYAISTWAVIVAVGPSGVIEASAADPAGTTLGAVGMYLGKLGADIVTILLVTSVFAANIATHNVTTRYTYSLAVDRIFPARLAAVHRRFVSPHVASIVTSILSVAFLAVLVAMKLEGTAIYAVLVGIGGYALIMLLLLTSVAVIRYFWVRPELQQSLWRRLIAPVAAALGLLVALYLASTNVATMIGGDQVLANVLMGLFYVSVVVGIVVALILKKSRPAIYARIGRSED